MKLFIDSMFLSAASMNARMADDEMPCDSGLLRGNGSAARQREPLPTTSAARNGVFMLVTWWMIGRDAGFRHAWIIADPASDGNQGAVATSGEDPIHIDAPAGEQRFRIDGLPAPEGGR